MAKLGQLVLAGGRWNDRQIVSREWIETSTAPKLKAADNQSYGYLWWLGRSLLNGREVHWVGALGRGGQSIRIVPELDLVVAVTAGYYQDYSPKAFQLQYGVFRDVLRGFRRRAEPEAPPCVAALVRLWPVELLRCCAQRPGQNRGSSSNGTETPIQRFSVRQDDLSVASRLPELSHYRPSKEHIKTIPLWPLRDIPPTSGRVLDDRRLRGSVAKRCAERGSVVGGVADALGGRKLGLRK